MKVIKNINNNVSVCLDDNNREVIAFGKGIGFRKPPYEINLAQIDRTFYELDTNQVALLSEVSPIIFEVVFEIIEKGNTYLGVELPKTFAFALADHINFAVERAKKGMVIQNPMVNEIRHLYEKEMRLGNWALKVIKKRTKVMLPQSEAGNIAMHFIDAEISVEKKPEDDIEKFVDDITEIVEDNLHIIIDRTDFNYSRFVTHLKYLLKRSMQSKQINTDNVRMYEKVKTEYPNLYEVVEKISEYITLCLKVEPNEEELLYLMLHLNRLCAREGL